MPVQKAAVRGFVVWVLLPTKHGKRLLRALRSDELTGDLYSIRFVTLPCAVGLTGVSVARTAVND